MTASKAPAVTSVAPRLDGLLSGSLSRVDYADAFRLVLPARAPADVDAIVRASLLATPSWVRDLVRARDGIVSWLGLETSGPPRALPPRFEVGQRLGIFRVLARREREVLLGQDDRHLDVRVLLGLVPGEPRALVVTTAVTFHHALGRAYFLPVAPVHRRIVPAMLEAAGRAMG